MHPGDRGSPAQQRQGHRSREGRDGFAKRPLRLRPGVTRLPVFIYLLAKRVSITQ